MNSKNIITAVLALFVVGSLVYVALGKRGETEALAPAPATEVAQSVATDASSEPDASPVAEVTQAGASVIVYYFHGSKRCATCHKFETYTRELLETTFADEMASGTIQWRMVNFDEDENSHFITDYELITKSVVVARMVDGEQVEWINLDKIWDLAGDKAAFTDYVRDGIQASLGDG